ncbi:hypothetical protein, partial [Arthrobacter sp.]|uniref:hypothetical protein n=1 Tax=Arthrobacter sp. TaxID=1667 RepID=UPI002812104E
MALHLQTAPAGNRRSPGHLYLVLLSAFALAASMIFMGGAVGAVPSASAATAVSQCNGIENVGGEAISCTVTVTNNLNLDTGEASSTVNVVACVGFANAALTCTPTTTEYLDVVTAVDQCNGSGNGGGGVVECSVIVVNNITGTATAIAGTVNQCIDSGQGGGDEPIVVCSPLGSTTNATVTQCNGSGNGGGGTMRVRCTVTSNTTSNALLVTINQCNGSGNGGGGYVTCTSSIETIITATPPVIIPPA